ncbi:DUF6325 family protein [Streptacidiphilus anmyonensis]|uniref:DUF6325 family protein n=1 Tax=Streptacidiphilus anmyonensis TaxID=405782 RepID=UPI0005A6BED6|nr:DUF6325 family protein [Streptacidiphilus anmyonensis]
MFIKRTEYGHGITTPDTEELGPVDYLVVEFPPATSHFTGEMAAELDKLVTSGTIRILDLVILTKGADGELDVLEVDDLDNVGELVAAEAQLAGLLTEEDVIDLAAAMEPGTTAGVLVWENLWAGPFASAARRSGGQLIANGRIPIQAILASIEADEQGV